MELAYPFVEGYEEKSLVKTMLKLNLAKHCRR